MFIKDEDALNFLATAVLLIFPCLGIVVKAWGFIWVALLLGAVLLVGRQKGLLMTALMLALGYTAPFIVYGTSALMLLSFVPLAGLITVWGWEKNWRGNVTFFWSAVGAAVLGAIITVPIMTQGLSALPVDELIESAIQEYRSSDALTMLQQQGLNEATFKEFMQRGLEIYALLLPSFASLFALFEFGFVFYLFAVFLPRKESRVPFTRWQLPWYAVWGAVLGLAFYLLGDQFSWAVLRGVGLNVMVIYGGISLVLGLSVAAYALQTPKIPGWLKIATVIVGFIYFYFSVVCLIICGLFDLVLNFRRLPEDA